VHHHQPSVQGELEVSLDRPAAKLDRRAEGGQRLLGIGRAMAAVSDDKRPVTPPWVRGHG
jgi:hypothetical protein